MLFFFLFLPLFSGHWTYHIAFLRCSGHNRKVSDARAILFFLFVFTVRFLLLLLFLLHCVSFISEQDSSFWFSRRPLTLTSFLTFFMSTRLPSISSYPLYNGALRVHGLRFFISFHGQTSDHVLSFRNPSSMNEFTFPFLLYCIFIFRTLLAIFSEECTNVLCLKIAVLAAHLYLSHLSF